MARSPLMFLDLTSLYYYPLSIIYIWNFFKNKMTFKEPSEENRAQISWEFLIFSFIAKLIYAPFPPDSQKYCFLYKLFPKYLNLYSFKKQVMTCFHSSFVYIAYNGLMFSSTRKSGMIKCGNEYTYTWWEWYVQIFWKDEAWPIGQNLTIEAIS